MSLAIPIKKISKTVKLLSPLVAGILLGACTSDDDADTTAPVISLQGSEVITLPYGQTWEDAGYSATDDVDGAIGVTVSGSVDVNKVGTYIISYTATDAEGNSTLVKRTVNVVDTLKPTISLLGDETVIVSQNTDYQEPGVTATDEYDGELTPVTIGELDTATPGTYTLTYTVTDSSGNHASVSRTVTVVEAPPAVDMTAEVTEFINNFNNALALAHQQNNGAILDKDNPDHQTEINKLAQLVSPYISDDFKLQAEPKDVYLKRLVSGYTSGNSFLGQEVTAMPMHLRYFSLDSVVVSEQGDQATITFYKQFNNEPLSATAVLHTWQVRKDSSLGWQLLGDTMNISYAAYTSSCSNYNHKDTPSCQFNYRFNPNQRLNFVDLADPEARAAAGVQTREYVRKDADGTIVDIFDIAELDYQAATIEIISKSGQVNKTLYLNEKVMRSVEDGSYNSLHLYNPELGEFYDSSPVYLGELDWYFSPYSSRFVVSPDVFEQGGTIRYRAYKAPIDYSNWQQPVLPIDEHTLTIEEPIVHVPTVQPVVVKPSSQSVDAFTKIFSASDNKFTLTFDQPPTGYSVQKATISARIGKTAMGENDEVLFHFRPAVSEQIADNQNSVDFDLTSLALNEAISKKTDPSATGLRADFIRLLIIVRDEKTGWLYNYFHYLNLGTLVGKGIPAQFTGDLFANIVVSEGTSASGNIGVSDANSYEGRVVAQQNVVSQYGTFSINASGEWSYQLNQGVAITDPVTDSFTISSDDGTTANISIKIEADRSEIVNFAASIPSSATLQSTFDVQMSTLGVSRTTSSDGKLVFKAKITEDLSKAATFSMGCSWNFHSSENRRVVTFYVQPDGQLEMWSAQLKEGGSYDDRSPVNPFAEPVVVDKVIFEQYLVPGQWSEFTLSWEGASIASKPLLHAWLDGEKLTSTHPAIPDDPTQGFVGSTLGGKTAVSCLDQMQFYIPADEQVGGNGALLVDDLRYFTDKDAAPFDYAELNERFATNSVGDMVNQITVQGAKPYVGDYTGGTTDNVLVVKAPPNNPGVGPTWFGGALSTTMFSTDDIATGIAKVRGRGLGADVFQVQTDSATKYGSFSINENGAWTYKLDQSNTEVVNIGTSQLTDTITLTAGDGSEQDLTISIESNVLATFVGHSSLSVNADGSFATTTNTDQGNVVSSIEVTDPDAGQAAFKPLDKANTSYGYVSIDASGAWTYAVDYSNSAVQALLFTQATDPAPTITDTLVFETLDGTQAKVMVTIEGSLLVPAVIGDLPVLKDALSSAQVSVDSVEASGSLTISDPNTWQEAFIPQSFTTVYGSFTIDAAGNWSYTLTAETITLIKDGSLALPFAETVEVSSIDGTQATVAVSIIAVAVPTGNKYLQLSSKNGAQGITNIDGFGKVTKGKLTLDVRMSDGPDVGYLQLFGSTSNNPATAMVDLQLKPAGVIAIRDNTNLDGSVTYQANEWFPVEITWDSTQLPAQMTVKLDGKLVSDFATATIADVSLGAFRISLRCGRGTDDPATLCDFDNINITQTTVDGEKVVVNESFQGFDLGEVEKLLDTPLANGGKIKKHTNGYKHLNTEILEEGGDE